MGQFKEMQKIQLQMQHRKNKEFVYAIKHFRKLKKGYEFFLYNSLNILNILSKQLKQKTITVVDRHDKKTTTKIVNEIDDLRLYDLNKVKGTIIPPATRYLNGFRCLHLYYSQLLDKLIELSGETTSYEDIDFKEHRTYLKDMQKYIKYYD